MNTDKKPLHDALDSKVSTPTSITHLGQAASEEGYVFNKIKGNDRAFTVDHYQKIDREQIDRTVNHLLNKSKKRLKLKKQSKLSRRKNR